MDLSDYCALPVSVLSKDGNIADLKQENLVVILWS
jgi:hypothetical protein